MSVTIRESTRRDATRTPAIAGMFRPATAPKLPAGLRPDDRSAATWSLSFARIRNAEALEHIGRPAAELVEDGDVQALALIEQLQERVAARGKALAAQYRRAARDLPEAAASA